MQKLLNSQVYSNNCICHYGMTSQKLMRSLRETFQHYYNFSSPESPFQSLLIEEAFRLSVFGYKLRSQGFSVQKNLYRSKY